MSGLDDLDVSHSVLSLIVGSDGLLSSESVSDLLNVAKTNPDRQSESLGGKMNKGGDGREDRSRYP